jgi:hypothetical protein
MIIPQNRERITMHIKLSILHNEERKPPLSPKRYYLLHSEVCMSPPETEPPKHKYVEVVYYDCKNEPFHLLKSVVKKLDEPKNRDFSEDPIEHIDSIFQKEKAHYKPPTPLYVAGMFARVRPDGISQYDLFDLISDAYSIVKDKWCGQRI